MTDLRRSRDRRHLALIAALVLVGLLVTAVGVLLIALGMDVAGEGSGRRSSLGMPVYVIGSGLIFIALGALELGHRVMKGPQKPGKRARY